MKCLFVYLLRYCLSVSDYVDWICSVTSLFMQLFTHTEQNIYCHIHFINGLKNTSAMTTGDMVDKTRIKK